jgi:drug/metabolite transporter (DMT)-like permease
MARKDRIDTFGATLLVGQSMLLGLNQVLIKVVNTGLGPVFQAGMRSFVAALPILAFALITRKRLSITDGSLVPGIACGILFALEFILLFQALDHTTVARATVFFYTMPFWVAMAAHFIIPGERLTLVRIAGLLLAFAGVAWALLGKGAAPKDTAIYGDIACLVAAVFWAGIALVTRATKFSNATPVMQLLYQLSVSSVILLPVAPLFGDLVRDFTPMIAGIFAFQVLVVVGVGFLVWFWVLSIYPASDMAAFGFLTPISGVIFGWLILGEEVSMTLLGALAMVSVGIVLINRKPRRLVRPAE